MSNTREVIKEMIKEEIGKLFGETPPLFFDDVPEIAEDEIIECELTEGMLPGAGGFKKRLRKQGGKLVVVKKRKKKLPLHLGQSSRHKLKELHASPLLNEKVSKLVFLKKLLRPRKRADSVDYTR